MKIVLTGGPSAGKTEIVSLIARQFGKSVATVPEAASILFRGGFPRIMKRQSILHQQRAIYYVQLELEALVQEQNPGKILVCDRGTVDGVAYLNGDAAQFFEGLNTRLENELHRYDYVIHLESAGPIDYDGSNPLRTEKVEEAKVLDDHIKELWAQHPRRLIIRANHDFREKVNQALNYASQIIQGKV